MRLIIQGNFIGRQKGSLRNKKPIGYVNINRDYRGKKWLSGFFDRKVSFLARLKRLFLNKKMFY